MWLTHSFGDGVEHSEQPLNIPKSTSSCSWFVKQVTLAARSKCFGRSRTLLQSTVSGKVG